MATNRTPLMAGNWKMNLNHQEAVVHVQKLAWTLSDKRHDYAKAEVAVLPPYTDLRSVQTLVDGDRLSIRYGATRAPTPVRSPPACSRSSAAATCASGTPSDASTTARPTSS
jgi:hypothetical protein